MIKITLSDETLKKHSQYFKKALVEKLNHKNFKPYTYEAKKIAKLMKIDYQRFSKKFEVQQAHFWGFIKNRAKLFAVGEFSTLKGLEAEMKKQFPYVMELIHSSYKNSKNESYSQYIYDIFGYERFKVKELYYYIKKEAERQTGENQFSDTVADEIVKILVSKYSGKKKEILNVLFPGGKRLKSDSFEKAFKKLALKDITMANFVKMNIFNDEWNDYAFVMESRIRVCPYCNRQYITPVFSNNGKVRADIDHFLAKSEYPYFSMSIYNLVPVCKACNQSLKGSKPTGYEDLNPYEHSLHEYFKFRVDFIGYDIAIDKIAKINEIDSHIEMFKLNSLYNYHRNQVKELYSKRMIYTEEYIKKIYEANKDLFNSEDDLKQLIVGYIADVSKLNDEAFLKLRRDVAEQLGFISGKVDAEMINQLSSLLKKI